MPASDEVADDQADDLHADIGLLADLSQDLVRADEPSRIVARVRIRPHRLEGVPRPPVSVALVLDTSGSMVGKPLEEARRAAGQFVDALADSDQVSLVVFHSVTETVVPLTTLDDGGRDRVRAALEGLEAVGTTDLAGGLVAGFAEVRKGLAAGGAARVVLLSDGHPNDATPILPNVEVAARQGITVTALGLGLEYDEELLGKVASTSGGAFAFAESPDQVARVFRDEVMDLQRIVGRNATLTLVPGPGIVVERVLGPAVTPRGRGFQAALGDLVEARDEQLLVVLRTSGHTDGSPIELLDAHLSFHDAVAQVKREERTFLASRASSSGDDVDASHHAEIELHTARAYAAAEALRAMSLARLGRLREAKRVVADAIKQAKKDAAAHDDQALRTKIAELADLRKLLPDLVPRPSIAMGIGGTPRGTTKLDVAAARAAKKSHAEAMGTLGF
jgi:Ca-activated chloride channel family protein